MWQKHLMYVFILTVFLSIHQSFSVRLPVCPSACLTEMFHVLRLSKVENWQKKILKRAYNAVYSLILEQKIVSLFTNDNTVY